MTYEHWVIIVLGVVVVVLLIVALTATSLANYRLTKIRTLTQDVDRWQESYTRENGAFCDYKKRHPETNEPASEYGDFQEVCECPSCGLMESHGMRFSMEGEKRFMLRDCKRCKAGFHTKLFHESKREPKSSVLPPAPPAQTV